MKVREAIPSDAPAVAKIHVDAWRTTYRGLVPDSILANLSYEAREQQWETAITHASDRNFVYVAENDVGEVVGFASGGPTRTEDPNYAGELYAIYVLMEAQGKGYGRMLAIEVARRLARADMTSMILWVFKDNHSSRRFYESLGGQYLYEKDFEIGGTILKEVAYGWKDTSNLTGAKDKYE